MILNFDLTLLKVFTSGSHSEILILLLSLFIWLYLDRWSLLLDLLVEWLLVLIVHFLLLHNWTLLLLHASVLRVHVLVLDLLMGLHYFLVIGLPLRNLIESVWTLSTMRVHGFKIRDIGVYHIASIASIRLLNGKELILKIELRLDFNACRQANKIWVVWLLDGGILLVWGTSISIGVCCIHHMRNFIFLIIQLLKKLLFGEI